MQGPHLRGRQRSCENIIISAIPWLKLNLCLSDSFQFLTGLCGIWVCYTRNVSYCFTKLGFIDHRVASLHIV